MVGPHGVFNPVTACDGDVGEDRPPYASSHFGEDPLSGIQQRRGWWHFASAACMLLLACCLAAGWWLEGHAHQEGEHAGQSPSVQLVEHTAQWLTPPAGWLPPLRGLQLLGLSRPNSVQCTKPDTDIDYVYSRLAGVGHLDNVVSAQDCCSLCRDELSCKAFTWVKDAHLPTGNPGQCWLKGGEYRASTAKPGVFSAFARDSAAQALLEAERRTKIKQAKAERERVAAMKRIQAAIQAAKTRPPMAAPTPVPTPAPTAPALYYRMEAGSCCCPAVERIGTQVQCEAALAALGLERRIRWLGEQSSLPSGCSWRQPGYAGTPGPTMHFNLAAHGQALTGLSPICMQAPSSGAAPPAFVLGLIPQGILPFTAVATSSSRTTTGSSSSSTTAVSSSTTTSIKNTTAGSSTTASRTVSLTSTTSVAATAATSASTTRTATESRACCALEPFAGCGSVLNISYHCDTSQRHCEKDCAGRWLPRGADQHTQGMKVPPPTRPPTIVTSREACCSFEPLKACGQELAISTYCDVSRARCEKDCAGHWLERGPAQNAGGLSL